jgi:dTDP-4-amino-4,6-dideoxygalactose transaminase
MQFIDLQAQYKLLKPLIDENIHKVLDSGKYIFGPEITELEEKLAEYAGVKHCVACASGTDALLMPLMAWGIGPGDAVFTSPFTFMSTAEVISLVGATPVFVDIDPNTYNMSPKALHDAIHKVIAEGKLNPKAVIPVDIFGLLAEYDEIDEIAEHHNLLVLQDSAQSFGGVYKGRRSGAFGHCSATSFFPAKPLGCYGDGGAVFTNDDELLAVLKSIRVHGMGSDRYDNVRIGINGRLDSIQAAVLLAKLTIFEDEIEKRNKVAARYSEKLSGKYKTPYIPEWCTSAWAQYCILSDSTEHRAELQKKLSDEGIPTMIYYPIPLHLQTAYNNLGYDIGTMPVSEAVAKRIFALPMYPYLSEDDQDKICQVLLD